MFKVYEVPELCMLFQLKERTIRAYIKEGLLPGRKVGKRCMVSESAVASFFKEMPVRACVERTAENWHYIAGENEPFAAEISICSKARSIAFGHIS